ncbi:hypothetical protein HPB52_023019 [Rhipicephalus sanguineus]|uniref:Mutator-like transposase domain-containing protein n=1 Tax=Rhipicephalus sanguineus TaxID=34632 RepID=A0A9D4PG41_RHISA|nr:hypothetical protein HPB52_023019 [Rhipicephalus sanguineus]
MAGGQRKFATAHAYGKKRKRRSRIPKAASSGSTATSSATCTSGCTTSTEAAAAQAMPVADDTSRTMRVDTLLVSEAEKVAIEHRAEAQRQKLSSLSATRRKQSLIGDSPEAAGCGTEFTLLSLPLLNQLLRCAKCEFCSGPLNDGDPRYSEWRARHKCQKNSSSKPGQMEVEAAKILFGRSLEKHGLRYTTMLCDGDSRAFNSLQEEKVYGFVPIEKEDCVNHIHKRMGAALRNLLQKSKGEGRASLGGKGRLTAELVTKLTNYYGWALKAHQGNIDEMENAVLATYYHVTSTDTKPQHSRCPKGEESWCAHNKAVARQQAPPKHRYNLPEYVAEALLPVYTRLSDRKLLERCQRGKTQNSNESLHSVIWSLVPKTKHASLFTVETAVAEAVARFNAGKKRASEAILKELHLSQGSTDVERCLEKDQRRLAACDKKHTRAENFRNAMKRRRVKENDSDYVPGGF